MGAIRQILKGIEGEATLTLDRLRVANVERCEEVFHGLQAWSPNDWADALGGEIGEALEVFGKLLQFFNTAKKYKRLEDADKELATGEMIVMLRSQLGKELADIIIYADLFAARMNIDLTLEIVEKFNEVSEKRGSSIRL